MVSRAGDFKKVLGSRPNVLANWGGGTTESITTSDIASK